ncbi:MAG: PAAR domain-containing protein [Byssovorax sp.]
MTTKVDLCSGHDACAPRPFATFSANVFAETFEVARQGDSLQEHACSSHPPHAAVVTHAWQNVLANGSPLAVIGSTVSCPSATLGTGRPSVLVGEGQKLQLRR